MREMEARKVRIRTELALKMAGIRKTDSYVGSDGWTQEGYATDFCVMGSDGSLRIAALERDPDVVVCVTMFVARDTRAPVTPSSAAAEEMARIRMVGAVVGCLVGKGLDCRAARKDYESVVVVTGHQPEGWS